MTTEAATPSRLTERLLAGDMVFPSIVTALVLALLQHALAEPMLLARLSDALPVARSTGATMLWIATILTPLLFLLVAAITAAFIWALGTFLVEGVTYRRALNIAAFAEVLRSVVLLLVLVGWSVGLVPLASGAASLLLGGSGQPDDSLGTLALSVALSPATIAWSVAIGYLAYRVLRWAGSSSVVLAVAAFTARVLLIALRTYHGTLQQ